MYWPTCEHSIRYPVSISGIMVGVGPCHDDIKATSRIPSTCSRLAISRRSHIDRPSAINPNIPAMRYINIQSQQFDANHATITHPKLPTMFTLAQQDMDLRMYTKICKTVCCRCCILGTQCELVSAPGSLTACASSVLLSLRATAAYE